MTSIYSYFLNEVLQSIDSILDNHWSDFDPQVGENQCQIRAYRIYQIALKYQPSSSRYALITLRNSICENLVRAERLFEVILNENNKVRFQPDRMSNFLCRHSLDFEIFYDIVFLAKARFLTRYGGKDLDGKYINIDFVKLCSDLDISKTRAKRIVNKFQRDISEDSQEFILGLAKDVQPNKMLISLFIQYCRQDEDGRYVSPTFLTSIIILKHIIQNNTACLFRIQDSSGSNFYFSYPGKNKSIKFVDTNIITTNDTLCVVINAITSRVLSRTDGTLDQYINELRKNLLKGIMANQAVHPQFPGKRLSEYKSNPFQMSVSEDEYLARYNQKINKIFFSCKAMAGALGCSMENDNLLFIKHLYCSMLAIEVKK